MDLGLAGRSAVVCASSHGLGRACATELARAGCRVVINGRNKSDLATAACAIRDAIGADVASVAGDLADMAVQAALVEAAGGAVDILVNNNGGPPSRDFRQVDRDAMTVGLTANMITPVELVQRVIDGMVERRWGRIVCITSGSVRMPVAGLDLSSGAQLGLTGFLAGVARQVARHNVAINFLLPGSFDTRRIVSLNRTAAEAAGITPEEAQARREAAVPARRLGRPDEFGAACAFLCSEQAGYIVGQSLLIDGGVFPGVL